MIALTLIGYLIYLVVVANDQGEQIKDGTWINHRHYAIREAILVLVLNFVEALVFGEIRALCLVLPAVRWLWFDGWLNIFRDKPLWYIGENAWLDKQLRKLPRAHFTQYIIKTLIICLSSLFYWLWSYSLR